jgi:Fe-S cluster assembly iron-binding protein IscA
MTTSERAAEKLKEKLIEEFLKTGIGFRLESPPDELGFNSIRLKLDRVLPTDIVIQCRGVKLILAPATAKALEKFDLDYEGDPGGFILNPENQGRSQYPCPGTGGRTETITSSKEA